jgi:hypothetical protein
MLELKNETALRAAILPGLDKDGGDFVSAIVKGTFTVDRRGALALSEEQLELQRGDAFHGEPGASSVKHEDESSPEKRGTDVVLIGHAWAGAGGRKAASVDVGLRVGKLHKVVRVHGDRAWYRTPTGVAASEPVPFARMPLVYERAFGGRDVADESAFEPRNPVGVGFTSATDPARIEGVRLPNLEDPEALVTSPADRPAPAGFGWIGRHWQPRARLAGTYDDAWRSTRAPLLPMNFDDRFFNGASSGLVSSKHLEGGEPLSVTNASESGDLQTQVPGPGPDVAISLRGEVSEHRPRLDTLIVLPDERRVVAIWRTTIACPRAFPHVEWVRVRERRSR